MSNSNRTGGKSGRSWKMERAGVNRKTQSRSRSNKYNRNSDSTERPASGDRSRVWVGGYTRSDGKKVQGYYRNPG